MCVDFFLLECGYFSLILLNLDALQLQCIVFISFNHTTYKKILHKYYNILSFIRFFLLLQINDHNYNGILRSCRFIEAQSLAIIILFVLPSRFD